MKIFKNSKKLILFFFSVSLLLVLPIIASRKGFQNFYVLKINEEYNEQDINAIKTMITKVYVTVDWLEDNAFIVFKSKENLEGVSEKFGKYGEIEELTQMYKN
jgi:hypothetical protein